MSTTNILRDLYLIKKPYEDLRAPYPWKNAFRINNPRYKYIRETYKKEIGESLLTDFRVIRFISLKYDITFDYVLIPTTSWHYFKEDVKKRLYEKGITTVTDVKFSFDNLTAPVAELLSPYVIIPDGVYVHLSLIKCKDCSWKF